MREFRVNWYRVFSRWVGLVLAVDRLAGPLFLLTAQVVFVGMVKGDGDRFVTTMSAASDKNAGCPHRLWFKSASKADSLTMSSIRQPLQALLLAEVWASVWIWPKVFPRGPSSCLSIFCLYLGRALLRGSLLCFRVGFAA